MQAPQPYSFGYNNIDEFGTSLYHKEEGDANNRKTGSYGYRDANGLYRHVNYIADEYGFRVTIETNEPGTQSGASADAVFKAKPAVTGSGVGVSGPSTAAKPYNGGSVYGNAGYSANTQRQYGRNDVNSDYGGYGNYANSAGYGAKGRNGVYGHHSYGHQKYASSS